MNAYKTYSREALDNLFSHFLVNDWSYSKVSTFARNEKAFEKSYIYNDKSKKSSSSVAGSAYHAALDKFFVAKKQGKDLDVIALQEIAYDYIDDIPANLWKIQKTTPTVEECKGKATKTVTALLNNFFSDLNVYMEEIAEILDVEVYCDEFIVVNGVDIPLPCHARLDLVIKTTSNKRVVIDHKSKAVISDAAELKFSGGVQGITYVLCYEEKTGEKVDEVWYIENKYSTNKDGSPQVIPFVIAIDDNVRRLYEALLYDPLKRMIEAVNNPDYVYMINDADNYEDKAELYNFWCKTMLAEVGEFDVDPTKRELVSKRLKKIRDSSLTMATPNIIKKFKENALAFIPYDLTLTDMTNEQKIEHVLRSFGLITKVAHVFNGYSSDTYLLEFSAGVKVTSIYGHKLDIASALNVSNVRVPMALSVYEGKSYLPVEVSKKRERDLIFTPGDLSGFRLPIGRDNFGNIIVWDLDNHSTPHALICGATGSGKSVAIKSIIEYAKLAGIKDIYLLDPKHEFNAYKDSAEVVNHIEDIEALMASLVEEMQARVAGGQNKKTLVIFDEFADAVAQARTGKALLLYDDVVIGEYADGRPKTKRQQVGEIRGLEENLKMLLQKGRSCGFRVVAATQRASTKVITGDAKVNFPVQVCFRVPKEIDSKIVLDEAGAESLAGMGDGLLRSPEYTETKRFQAYYKP